MTTQKHTPGPWRYTLDTTGDDATNLHVQAGEKTDIVWGCGCCGSPSMDGTIEEAQANARLIAAAPDLLEALRDMQSLASLLAANCGDRVDCTEDPRWAAATAAIAKAIGQAS